MPVTAKFFLNFTPDPHHDPYPKGHTTITRQLTTALTAATALMGAPSTVLAQEATPDTWLQANGTSCRAAVLGDLAIARQAGTMAGFERGGLPQLVVSAPCAEVRAETREAIAEGQVAALDDQAYRFGTIEASRMAGTPVVRAAR